MTGRCDVAWCRNLGLYPIGVYYYWVDLDNKPIKVDYFCIKHTKLWKKYGWDK